MDVKPLVHGPEGDRRFAGPAWSENPPFFAVRLGYLAARAGDLVGDAKAWLATGFLLDALAPDWTRSRRNRQPAWTDGLVRGGRLRRP
jgi:hypothetical protein